MTPAISRLATGLYEARGHVHLDSLKDFGYSEVV